MRAKVLEQRLGNINSESVWVPRTSEHGVYLSLALFLCRNFKIGKAACEYGADEIMNKRVVWYFEVVERHFNEAWIMDIQKYLTLGRMYCDATQGMRMPKRLKDVFAKARGDTTTLLAVCFFGMHIDGQGVEGTAKKLCDGYYGLQEYVEETAHHIVAYQASSSSSSSPSGSHSDPSSASSSLKQSKIDSQVSPATLASTIKFAGSGSKPPL